MKVQSLILEIVWTLVWVLEDGTHDRLSSLSFSCVLCPTLGKLSVFQSTPLGLQETVPLM